MATDYLIEYIFIIETILSNSHLTNPPTPFPFANHSSIHYPPIDNLPIVGLVSTLPHHHLSTELAVFVTNANCIC